MRILRVNYHGLKVVDSLPKNIEFHGQERRVMTMPSSQLIDQHEFLQIIARGKGELQRLLGDPDLGTKGGCYEFASAVKRVLGDGAGYAIVKRHDDLDGTYPDHVLTSIDGWLIDAFGIRDENEYDGKLTGSALLVHASDDDIAEIEQISEPWVVNYIAYFLEHLVPPPGS